MMNHEAVEGGLMVAEILLLHGARRLGIEVEQLLHILPDPALDLVEQPAGRWIQRVVQVENPALGVLWPHKTIIMFRGEDGRHVTDAGPPAQELERRLTAY